jgi:hypothetical protein
MDEELQISFLDGREWKMTALDSLMPGYLVGYVSTLHQINKRDRI